jgi:beta-barrel assembly-enhancing protease
MHKTFFSTGNRVSGVLLTALLLCSCPLVHAQFNTNYEPVRFSGSIPQEVLQDAKDKTDASLDEQETNLKLRDQKQLYTAINYNLSEIFLSGSVYFNDELTAYVRNIIARLLKDEPEKLRQLKVYVTRLTEMNATCWGDGTIFVNIGLLARMENEAQLAFVLSHEISHYFLKHSILSFKKQKQIEENLNKGKEMEALFRQLRFSRKNEFEADMNAFKLMCSSEYSAKECLNALRALKDAGRERYNDSLSLKDIFESKDFKLDKEYYLSDSEFARKEKKKKTTSQRKSKKSRRESESTHPSVDRRVDALDAELKKAASKGESLYADEAVFQRIRHLATFEMLASNFSNASYARALYEALQLQRRYPDNEYVAAQLCNSLYWLYIYKSSGSTGNITEAYKSVQDRALARVLYFIHQVSKEDLLALTEQQVLKYQKKHGSNEELSILTALVSEEKEGKEKAAEHYKNYLDRFPTGKHAVYATHKLK